MKDYQFTIFTTLTALMVMGGVSILMWSAAKRINYELQYRDMVVETLKDKVKQECFK